MGRAGADSGGDGFSSGGHSFDRQSGGHRPGGSNRAGRGSHYNHYGGFSNHHYHHYSPYPTHYYRSPLTYGISVIIAIILIIFTLIPSSSSVPKSTQIRTKLDTGIGYTNDCVIDELGWFDNEAKAETNLKKFYDKTGIQPYVVFKTFNPDLATDAQKQQFAKQWYDDNINNESSFLFMYFAEQNTDADVGYMAYVNGKQVSSVMDSEAIEIFWAYIDQYWYSDMSTDDMIIKVFNSTANRIMDKTTTMADVGKVIFKIVLAVIIISGIVIIMVVRRKHKAAENAETERILNSPSDYQSKADDLAKKYTKKES